MNYSDLKKSLGIPLTLTAIDNGFTAETPDTINKDSTRLDYKNDKIKSCERGKNRAPRPFEDMTHLNPETTAYAQRIGRNGGRKKVKR